MSNVDLVVKKIKEIRAMRNRKPVNVVPLFPSAVPKPYETAAAFALGTIGVTVLLLVITIAVLLG